MSCDTEFEMNKFYIGEKCAVCGREIEAFKIFPDSEPIRIMCQCEQERLAKEESEKREKIRKEKIEKMIIQSGMPPKQLKMSFDNFAARAGTEEPKRAAEKFLSKFFDMKKGLLFVGPCGSGKTHLACAIGNELLKKGVWVKFVRVTDLFERIRGTYDGSGENEAEVVEEYKECRLLILDDLGVNAPSEWSRSVLHSIIDYRINYELPTIVTTNLTNKELATKMDSRTIDRLKEGFFMFVLSASSYRQEG